MLGSKDVRAIADCSYRQLDYWQRCGLFTRAAPGTGFPRELDSHDALLATCYRMLSSLGADARSFELIRDFRGLDDLVSFGEVMWLFVAPDLGWVSTHPPASPCYALPIGLLAQAYDHALDLERKRGSLV